jgi:hypothetical protein
MPRSSQSAARLANQPAHVDNAQRALVRVGSRGADAVRETAFDHFFKILTQPDNIPIVGLIVLLFFFTYLGLREARKNDRLIELGREDDILERMQD